MRWEKRGLVFTPPTDGTWIASHAALPFAEPVGSHEHRVLFSGRDERGRSRIGWFVIDLSRDGRVIDVGEAPLLDLGPLGAFDDSGVTSSWLVRSGDTQLLYYTGWSLGVSVPFYLFAGVAGSTDNGPFLRLSTAPLLERTAVDPYLTASPCVLVEGDRWRMWYVSATGWEPGPPRPRHKYHIRYAESQDGVRWARKGHVCVDFASDDEYAFGRPSVLRVGGLYRMWYCVRGDTYRLGYAESEDGQAWARADGRAGLDPSRSGWDSEMIAYPHVFEHDGALYMLYNGNDYGRTGIGLAMAHLP